MKVQLSLQDDGSVQFKDENGDILDDYYVAQAKRQGKEVFYNWLEENCAEINQKTTTSSIFTYPVLLQIR
jgi:hypothetical protein